MNIIIMCSRNIAQRIVEKQKDERMRSNGADMEHDTEERSGGDATDMEHYRRKVWRGYHRHGTLQKKGLEGMP